MNKTTRLAVDELDVSRALRVAVASTVFGTCLVGREPRHATILVHRREVECAIESTRKLGQIHVEGKLLVEDLEHLVFGVARHKVHTTADILPVTVGLNELEGERVTARCNTVRPTIVGTFEGTVGCAALVIRAETRVPSVARVAVVVAALAVDPTPVGIENDASRYVTATTALCAFLPAERGVSFGLVCADKLSLHREGREDDGEKSKFWKHVTKFNGAQMSGKLKTKFFLVLYARTSDVIAVFSLNFFEQKAQ